MYNGISQQQPSKMNDAQINAVRASVFSRPLASLGGPHPSQVAAGRSGALGAFGGHTQGPVGANVLQTGQNAPKPGTAASSRPQSQPTSSNAPTGSNAPQNGPQNGLAMILPLLGFLLGHLLSGGQGLPGTGAGGFGGATPMGAGKV
jgi:hypothetical protein